MGLDRDRVLRTFLRDGQLVAMPGRASRRRVLLEYVVCAFEPGVRLSEREVDAVLRAFYPPDWVSLRRYLIDEGLMARADGWYWRTGGYVDVGPAGVDPRAAGAVEDPDGPPDDRRG